jgi:hypothetical protein
VTLLHSRDRLLPIYPEEMHETSMSIVHAVLSCRGSNSNDMRVFPPKVVARCIELGINLVLGERAQSTETKVVYEDGQERPELVVTTSKGRVIEGDMIVRRMGLASTKCFLTFSPAHTATMYRPTTQHRHHCFLPSSHPLRCQPPPFRPPNNATFATINLRRLLIRAN